MNQPNPAVVAWLEAKGRESHLWDERLALADAAVLGHSFGDIAVALHCLGIVTRQVGSITFWLFPDPPTER